MTRKAERCYPEIGGAFSALALGVLLWLGWVDIPGTAKDLLQAVLNVSAIAIGFLATAKSILVSLEGKEAIDRVKEFGNYDTLLEYMASAINVSFVVAIVSAFGLLCDFSEPRPWHLPLAVTWVFFAVMGTLSCHRIIGLFGRLLRYASRSRASKR